MNYVLVTSNEISCVPFKKRGDWTSRLRYQQRRRSRDEEPTRLSREHCRSVSRRSLQDPDCLGWIPPFGIPAGQHSRNHNGIHNFVTRADFSNVVIIVITEKLGISARAVKMEQPVYRSPGTFSSLLSGPGGSWPPAAAKFTLGARRTPCATCRENGCA
jgi:hypothetical protein